MVDRRCGRDADGDLRRPRDAARVQREQARELDGAGQDESPVAGRVAAERRRVDAFPRDERDDRPAVVELLVDDRDRVDVRERDQTGAKRGELRRRRDMRERRLQRQPVVGRGRADRLRERRRRPARIGAGSRRERERGDRGDRGNRAERYER
jgi:hypothetical protein